MYSCNQQRLEDRITIAKKANNDTVGKIEYLYSGKSIRYTDSAELIKAYKESIKIYGLSGVNIKITEGNAELAYRISKIQYAELGEELPSKEEFFKKHNINTYIR